MIEMLWNKYESLSLLLLFYYYYLLLLFEETIMFTVPYERIRQTSLIVSVMDYDRLRPRPPGHVTGSDVMDYDRVGRNEPIGQLVLGTKSGPMELKHWNEMFAKSRTDVIKWHLLKDLS